MAVGIGGYICATAALKNPRNWSERQGQTFPTRDPPRSSSTAGIFWAIHSRLPPIIEAARTIKRHLPGLLTYTKHRITNAASEGTNGRMQLFKANAQGYRNFILYWIAILFHCGTGLISTPWAVHHKHSTPHPHKSPKRRFLHACIPTRYWSEVMVGGCFA